MSANVPRPEFPRPDFRREEWLNLNGLWGFDFDDHDLGEKEEWHLREGLDKKILVPYPFQSRLSEINEEAFHNIVWYQREFHVPESWRDKRVLLHFGAVDHESKVWLNGKLLGSNRGGYVPFSFDVTNLLKEENSLVLRVFDAHGDQPRGKQDSQLRPQGVRYMRVTGIWQTVWLETTGKANIMSYRIIPDIDESEIAVEVRLVGDIEGCDLKATIFFANVEVAEKEVGLEEATVCLKVPIPHMRTWSPEIPDIYDVTFELSKGEDVLDRVYSYFGMRKISVKGNRILLNNQPYYLKMALDQGYYPDGLYTAPKDEDLKRDVEAAKTLGLNGVRKHQLASDPRYLYWCDKIGLLVWGEMADWGMPLKNKDVFWDEWKRVINRDFNHPCIMAWTPFNERSEAYKDASNQEALLEIYTKTKNIDPTRLVIDTSGYAHTETDILDIHEYDLMTGYDFKQAWHAPHERYLKSLADGFDYKGQPIVLSEWGGWGMTMFNPIVDRPKYAYHIVQDEYAFISRYREFIESLVDVTPICGFCYTQLYDVEGEVNGYLTYDRKWKVPPEKIAEIHRSYNRS